MSANVELDAFCAGHDLSETVSRARFEELCADLFKRTLGPGSAAAAAPTPAAPLLRALSARLLPPRAPGPGPSAPRPMLGALHARTHAHTDGGGAVD